MVHPDWMPPPRPGDPDSGDSKIWQGLEWGLDKAGDLIVGLLTLFSDNSAAPVGPARYRQPGIIIFDLYFVAGSRLRGASAAEAWARIDEELKKHPESPKFILNMKHIVSSDASGLGTIAKIAMEVESRNGAFALCAANQHIQNLLILGRLDEAIAHYDTEEEGISALSSS